MSIKVAIADDHPVVLKGLQNIINFYEHVELYGSYTSGQELLEGLTIKLPNVLLLDIQLPDKTGNELARIISKKYPDIKILALTNMDSEFHVKDMMEHGCSGYLTKHTDEATILTAIEKLFAGETYLEPALQKVLDTSISNKNKKAQKLVPLTQREKEVLQLIALEHTNQQIADKLFIALRTVENHRLSITQKLGAKNTVGLIKIAIQMGLIG